MRPRVKTSASQPGAAMTPAPHSGAVRPRGRPRDLAARDAILRAARELLDAAGPGAVTIDAVAARAGVGKPTVYRWWPDRHAVTMAALMSAAPASVHAPSPLSADHPAPLAALSDQLQRMVETFGSRTGRNVAAMIASADPHTELAKAFRNHFVLARRDEGRALLGQAMTAGTLRADLDTELALDLIYGPIFFRLLVGHAPLDASFARGLVRDALRGLAAGAAGEADETGNAGDAGAAGEAGDAGDAGDAARDCVAPDQ
jgi:AcrR family transcriptional regulator